MAQKEASEGDFPFLLGREGRPRNRSQKVAATGGKNIAEATRETPSD